MSASATSSKPIRKTAPALESHAEPEAIEALADAGIPVVDEPEPKGITQEPLVDLDDDEGDTRDTVRYGGKLYELRALNEFGIGKQHELTRGGREFFRLWSSEEELSETDQQRLDMLLNRLLDEVMVAPVRLRRSMPDGKKSRVVLAFTLAPVARRMAAMQQMATDTEAGDSGPITAA